MTKLIHEILDLVLMINNTEKYNAYFRYNGYVKGFDVRVRQKVSDDEEIPDATYCKYLFIDIHNIEELEKIKKELKTFLNSKK